MRKLFYFALSLLIISSALTGKAHASSNRFYDLSSGRQTAGVFTSFSDDFKYYFGQVRLKPGGTFEAGFKGGVSDVTKGSVDTTGAYLGLDALFKIASFENSFFSDLYGAVGFSSILKSRKALNEFFITPLLEKPLSSGSMLSINGSLGLELDFIGGSLVDSDDFEAYVTAGLTFNLGSGANIFAEIKGGTGLVGGMGVNFEF